VSQSYESESESESNFTGNASSEKEDISKYLVESDEEDKGAGLSSQITSEKTIQELRNVLYIFEESPLFNAEEVISKDYQLKNRATKDTF
jgi:hypothetical protein